MEWSDLRIFLAVAREGTLGAAARKLGRSQPTMGRRLRALEQAVGQTLFQRTDGGFVLTDEGSAVLSHTERIEEEALALQRQLASHDQHLDGTLRIASSDWFGIHMLTPVFAEFARPQPRVVVELLTDARLYSLPRREADLAFRITPFREPEVISRRLMHIEIPGARSASPESITPELKFKTELCHGGYGFRACASGASRNDGGVWGT
jgi:DNA-binding transcriptional LysR family regulator